MGMIIWGVLCAVVGAFLSIMCYMQYNTYEYALRVVYGGEVNWAEPLFYVGLVMAIVGVILLVIGLTRQSSDSSTATPSASSFEPLFCTNCGEQILSGNFVCPMCRHDNSLDLFLRSADPAGRAAEINHAWYKFGLDKRFRAETKELASLVIQEQRQGGKNESANRAFLAKFH